MLKNIFMCLMVNLKNFGKITTANFSEDGEFVGIHFEDDKYHYSASVTRKAKIENITSGGEDNELH